METFGYSDQSINQSIKTDLHSAVCRQRIGGDDDKAYFGSLSNHCVAVIFKSHDLTYFKMQVTSEADEDGE